MNEGPSRRMRWAAPLLVVVLLAIAALACTRESGEVITITATPLIDEMTGQVIIPPSITPTGPTKTPIQPTPNPARTDTLGSALYTVQAGDTLGTIALRYGVTVEELLALNPQLANPDALEVGQTINTPGGGLPVGPDMKLIPDSELVYGPTAADFSITSVVKYSPGFLRAYSEEVDGEVMTGVEIIHFVAKSYSVNPRLLLALLEYRGEWLTNPFPPQAKIDYPMGIQRPNREGLMRQMLDAADALNAGYYGWKYRGDTVLSFDDGVRILFAPTLNPGTVAVQKMLSVATSSTQWQRDVAPTGFFDTYLSMFGDPFVNAYEPITPPNLTQPELTLPFARGEEWVYTGGPHGAYNSGSAWGAVDFAPPRPSDELIALQGACYVSPYWVTAVAPGVIARSGDGYVILDLDGDGDETTGWTIVYLHIDNHEVIAPGTRVKTGDRLGHPSCEGGFSNGTHLHISRRYNGEWIPVECEDCMPGAVVPPFTLGEWTLHGYPRQEYQGYMTHAGGEGTRQADQMREFQDNKVMW
jgi:LasA protease